MASKPYPDCKRGVWYMKYKPDPTGDWVRIVVGKDPRLKTGNPPKTPPINIQDRARDFAEIEYRAKHGLGPAPSRAKALSGYATAYCEAFAGSHKPGSVRQLKRHLERFTGWAASRNIATVQGVTRATVRDYLEWRITQVSHDTLKTEVRYLATLWARAVEDGLVQVSPWARPKIPGKSTRSSPTYWTAEEVALIASCAAKQWQGDLILLMANTGLRISTALAARWSWVDWVAGVIRIPPEESAQRDGVKTAYPVAMNRTARAILTKRHKISRSADGLIFPNPYRSGGMVPYDSAREAINRAIKKAGVKPGTPHDLRHTYARLLSKYAPANVVQSQLGHSAAATTQIYTQLEIEDVAKELKDFGIGDA